MAAKYRADYYLFRNFLMGLGCFRDAKVVSHDSMKMVFGINRPFKIRLDGKWQKGRAALIRGGTPHYLDGEGDWQIVLWIDPNTSLWSVLDRNSLKGRDWAIHDIEGPPALTEVIQTVGDTPDPRAALDLAELLVKVYSGARGVSANWDIRVNKALEIMEKDPGGVDAASLAVRVGCPYYQLETDFRRVMGSGLEEYLHRRKWMGYIIFRQSGMNCQESLSASGLPGWEGLKDRFEARYGLDLNVLDNSLPFVRVYEGPDDRPVVYLP